MLGRLADGRLVFGWCLDCLEEEGCLPKAARAPRSRTHLPSVTRRILRTARFRDSRQLAMMGIAGLALAWGIVLAFVGGFKLPGSITGSANPLGNGTRPFLVAGGGLMAIVSLALWVALLEKSQRRRVALKFVQVASALTVFASLAWGIIRHQPGRDPLLILVVALAFAVSWAAHRLERKFEQIANPAARVG